MPTTTGTRLATAAIKPYFALKARHVGVKTGGSLGPNGSDEGEEPGGDLRDAGEPRRR